MAWWRIVVHSFTILFSLDIYTKCKDVGVTEQWSVICTALQLRGEDVVTTAAVYLDTGGSQPITQDSICKSLWTVIHRICANWQQAKCHDDFKTHIAYNTLVDNNYIIILYFPYQIILKFWFHLKITLIIEFILIFNCFEEDCITNVYYFNNIPQIEIC